MTYTPFSRWSTVFSFAAAANRRIIRPSLESRRIRNDPSLSKKQMFPLSQESDTAAKGFEMPSATWNSP
eukprot:8319897-Lingulodinium_polyedra.AAC.1